MWIADNWNEYEVIDTSSGEKLERWGNYILGRSWLEKAKRPLSQKLKGRRRLGIFQAAAGVGTLLSHQNEPEPHIPSQAFSL